MSVTTHATHATHATPFITSPMLSNMQRFLRWIYPWLPIWECVLHSSLVTAFSAISCGLDFFLFYLRPRRVEVSHKRKNSSFFFLVVASLNVSSCFVYRSRHATRPCLAVLLRNRSIEHEINRHEMDAYRNFSRLPFWHFANLLKKSKVVKVEIFFWGSSINNHFLNFVISF